MTNNPLEDLANQAKQYHIEKAIQDLAEEVQKINIKLTAIEEYLKKSPDSSDKTYIK